jgi:uncharacterized protein DUF4326
MKRIQRTRQITLDNTIFVGNGTLYANPFNLDGGRRDLPGRNIIDRQQIIVQRYAAWLAGECNIQYPDLALRRIILLKNIYKLQAYQNLSCWCAIDAYCHADVIIEIIHSFNREDDIERGINDYFNLNQTRICQ